MSLEPCPTCGFHRNPKLPHTCPPTWLVWCPEDDIPEPDASTVYETDPESAAVAWAEEYDRESADYDIAQGSPAVVYVRDTRTGELSRWTVSGEYDPTYYAEKIDDPPPSDQPDGEA